MLHTQKISNKMSQVVEISDGNVCPLDRAEFLTNYTNKQNFVNLLACKLELHGFKLSCVHLMLIQQS